MPTSAAQGAIRMEVSSNNNSNTLKLNTRTALTFLENGISNGHYNGHPITGSDRAELRRQAEQKIQQELQDLKTELDARLS
ncbi:uncharacterized protein LOC110184134 isoform X1 [Drosophila serrata]|uniref:uncharacterized protein LOC110184134 isoform X1 n=1 Tax=Drosophila serrata TaxID=7274 RepID=UPI000A1D2EBD|nr:uncharacterized protein LOC110184134 isoform X1 [Drosophila serrata]